MTKPFTRLRPFSRRFSAKAPRRPSSSDTAGLRLSFLDEIACFESLRAYEGRFFCLRRHLDRLGESCAALGRKLPFSKSDLSRWLSGVLGESGFRNALVRVSVHWDPAGEGCAAAIARRFTAHPPEWYRRGVELRTSARRGPSLRAVDPQIKSSQYVPGVLTFLDFLKSPPREAVFLNHEQCAAEGTVSNLFIVRPPRTLLTPPAASGILRGVTRDVVMTLAGPNGLEAAERPLTRHDVYSADECFITNTSSEVLPVVLVDGRRIGKGVPGPVTARLANSFKRFVKSRREL